MSIDIRRIKRRTREVLKTKTELKKKGRWRYGDHTKLVTIRIPESLLIEIDDETMVQNYCAAVMDKDAGVVGKRYKKRLTRNNFIVSLLMDGLKKYRRE